MSWINNKGLIFCGVFYLVLCIFSIVIGIIYITGRRKLNQVELSQDFVEKLDTEEKMNIFTIRMGFVTFLVGLVQGIVAYSIFRGHSIILYFIALGFTIFSIGSVLIKLIGKKSLFSIIKLILYIIVLIILLLPSSRVLFFDNGNINYTSNSIPVPKNVVGRYEEDLEIKTKYNYELLEILKVDGRQGIAYGDDSYYISGSTTLSHYDKNWNLLSSTNTPFKGFKNRINHIGDIDFYKDEIYAGVEYFMDGKAKNIQIAVYDKDFNLKKTYQFDSNSGQSEVSGIAVDPDNNSIWMCSWADSESGRYLYRYNLSNGKYLGKYHLQAPPQYIQGIAYLDGNIYITADDGTADLGEADHIYRVKIDLNKTTLPVMIERTLDDVILQGEIEGLSFDKTNERLLVSYNRGAQIILGMPKGLYKGYDKEIHEVFVYGMTKN